jgi:DNA-damage-inducible protein J
MDDSTKTAADNLFSSLGLDTSTAVRMFIAAALEYDGLPFAVRHNYEHRPKAELREAMEDIHLNRNLNGPFATAEEAVCSMLKE